MRSTFRSIYRNTAAGVPISRHYSNNGRNMNLQNHGSHSAPNVSGIEQRNQASGFDSDNSSNPDTESESYPEEFKFCHSENAGEVLEGLNSLRQEGKLCDVVLSVEEQTFPAHKCVLSSFSSYFRAMFNGDMAESKQDVVRLNGIDGSSLSLLLQFAYTSEIMITLTNVQSLLTASNLLQVMSVRAACCHFLEKHIDATNCVGILCFAEQLGCQELQAKAEGYTLKHFVNVSQHEEFINLPADKLVEIISSDDLEVDKEEETFAAVLRWLHHDLSGRQDHLHKVLEHVRLPLCSPYFLHDCVASQAVIMQSPQCRRLVEEAKLYHLLPDRRSELHCLRTKLRKNAKTLQVIVAAGGEDDKVVLRTVDCYNPVTKSWSCLACLPYAISKHGLVLSGSNHLYLCGGEFPDGSASSLLWRYDSATDSWHDLAQMSTPRSELGVAMLDGYLYAVGGWQGCQRLKTVERYDPTSNTWELVTPMKTPLTGPAVVAYDGYLYVIGGSLAEDGDGNGTELVQRFDSKTQMWSEIPPISAQRAGPSACVVKGKIYVIGGWQGTATNTNKVECFDIARGVWEDKAPMIERRYRPGVSMTNGYIYVLGGEEGWDKYHDTIERYNPDVDKWEMVDIMPSSRSWLSCVTFQVRKDDILKTA
ncbi:kelch-like protein diablo [Artemia franciscana]|uniref:kelch-like protein diablo n=1 Tax=Artemia franciscana TaxID=6661 RepID=UPI0032DBB3A8